MLTLFTVLALFSLFYYHSYLVVVYSYRNTYNSRSCRDHTLHLAHCIHIRMRLQWVSLTCVQAGLKCGSRKANPNSLTSN